MNRISRRTAAEQADALLEVGRNEPALQYDVELGLARHHAWMQSDAPMPEWAAAGVGSATRSMLPVVIKTLVSSLLLGVLAGGVWLSRGRPEPQPSAAGVAASSSAAGPAPEPASADRESAQVDPAAPQPLPLSEPASSVGEAPARRTASERRTTRSHTAHRAPVAAGASPRAEGTGAPAARVEPAAPAPHEQIGAARLGAASTPVPKPLAAQVEPAPPTDLVEMQQVAAAEQLLARAPERALALVHQGDERFARGYFQQERAYIAIMALIRLGRMEEARTRAASFARRFPALPYGARIRSALEAAAP